MSLSSRIVAMIAKLPRAETRDIVIDRNIKIPMPDGIELSADHYYPRNNPKAPMLLIRSPYGIGFPFGTTLGVPFAERGFQVLIQSCRGTFDSGGTFNPHFDDHADALATVAWIRKQPWFNGELATAGGSYLGFVQWAIAGEDIPEWKAMSATLSPQSFCAAAYVGGSFALDSCLSWAYNVASQEERTGSVISAMLSASSDAKKQQVAFDKLPLIESYKLATGKPVFFFEDWLNHTEPDDKWWEPIDFTPSISRINRPVHLMGGWYDFFLTNVMTEYGELVQAGKVPYLTVGPWAHMNMSVMFVGLREQIAWLQTHVLGKRGLLRDKPVRLFVMGSKQWRDFDEWPPTGYVPERWYLQGGRGLSSQVPATAKPDYYRYDPASPTPAIGGTALTANAGPKDQKAVESRSDVLVYTSKPLEKDTEVIGPVQAALYVKSSLQYTDFFARLCDVDASGKSINICDGIMRLKPGKFAPEADGAMKITIDLWPTANLFKRGHRIRLQIASGHHPRFARNTGSGEPLATASKLVVAKQEIYHDPAHPSCIILPVKQ
jgi:hypothetical protein